MSEQVYEYVLTIPSHGPVGIGPTEDREAVRSDYHAWLDEAGEVGTIMRRPVADWDVDPEQEYERTTTAHKPAEIEES